MPRRPTSAVNWEMLRSEVGRAAVRQTGGLALVLAGPLLISLYTLFRPWQLDRGIANLLQAALFLAAWNMLFTIFCFCNAWLQPRASGAEQDQRHLPLSPLHFELRPLSLASLLPLAAAGWGIRLAKDSGRSSKW